MNSFNKLFNERLGKITTTDDDDCDENINVLTADVSYVSLVSQFDEMSGLKRKRLSLREQIQVVSFHRQR